MCGINGFNFRDENLIDKMNELTKHRGPDARGVFLDENISLGHNRLKIIDLSEKAAQPMASGDGNLVIVFNGEIYNFQELKRELSAGYDFKSESDTEVILAAYKKWGGECVKKFNGIFAFAIWDKIRRELFLARDFIGVKPLYYYFDGGTFIFSSEIKAILAHRIKRALNIEAFNHYLRILYAPEPLTMFEGIYKMPPATFAFFRDNRLFIQKYWEAKTAVKDFSKEEWRRKLRDVLCRAVRRQLISDRPVGLYLSGGLDSSAVLYCLSQVGSKIDTFSVGFELSAAEQSEKFNQDFELAGKTARHFGAKHNELLIGARDVRDNLEKAIWHLDEPISNPTIIPMYCLARLAKEKVAVTLNGDGGDELFGGYERYRLSRLAGVYQTLPRGLRSVLGRMNKNFAKLNTPAGVERFALFMFLKNEILNRTVVGNFLNSEATKKFFNEHFFSAETDLDFESAFLDVDRRSWLVDEALMRTDKMSMSAGLEARVPLLDKEMAELAYQMPIKYKVNPFGKKIILKEAFRGKLPDYLFKQPKRGWFSPGAKWLRNKEINDFAKQILSPGYNQNTAHLFKWPEISGVFDRHCVGVEYNFTVLWALITFQIWAKIYDVKLP